jgi:beta-glucosidase
MTDILRFPEGFRWGAATAAHQNEGDNTANNWHLWEQQPGHIYQGQRCEKATGWWDLDLAAADFDRAAEMGLNALRLSVEWSRIEPAPGEYSRDALGQYARMIRLLRERGIEPMVTLHHFTDPAWLDEVGGWENPLIGDYFSRFTEKVVDALGDQVTLWCTINEPIVYAFYGFSQGLFPPGGTSLPRAVTVLRNMLLAHGRSYRTIHRLQNNAAVGLAHHMRYFLPGNPRSPLDRRVTAFLDQVANKATLDAVTKGKLGPLVGVGQTIPQLIDTSDYIGLNYYSTAHISFDATQPGMLFARQYHDPNLAACECTSDGQPFCEINPPGMYLALKALQPYGKPVHITENGLPDKEDKQRPYVLTTYLSEVWKAIRDGVDVQGYYHWTLVDNFEWSEGWNLRFGLIELDPLTGERTPRTSAAIYSRIAQANGVPRALLEQWAPADVGKYFE